MTKFDIKTCLMLNRRTRKRRMEFPLDLVNVKFKNKKDLINILKKCQERLGSSTYREFAEKIGVT
ncbi:MAG: hypothetical protein ABIF92_00215, partial [archaeon]